MIEKTKNAQRIKGVSLVGTMVSISILSIAVIGTTRFRYYSALDSRKAAMHRTSARVALALCESWRATESTETYNPIGHLGSELNISQSAITNIEYDATFTLLGNYRVVLNGVDYNATLSWKDVSSGLRALNVIVSWPHRGGEESRTTESFILTNYVIITN